MGTRMNPMAGRYFNDPSFASAVSNLAGAFGPPSAEEYLVGEQLRGTRTQNDALTQLMAVADGNPDMLAGIAKGGWLPVQGFEAMRGALANERYGIDKSAETSRLNNTADNDRALNETILGIAADPNGRQALDEDILRAADLDGFPSLPAAGPVAPTAAQVEGSLLSDAQRTGLLTPQDAATAYRSGIPVEQIILEGSTLPVIVPRSESHNKTPFINKGAEASAKPVTLQLPDGTVEAGTFDPTSSTYRRQDGSVAPAGTQAFNLASPQGTSSDVGLTTGVETQYARTFAAVKENDLLLDELESLIRNNPGAAGTPGAIQRMGQDLVQVAKELGAAFGDDTVPITEQQFAAFNSQLGIGQGYDPVFQQLRTGLLQLGYLNAKRDKGGGEPTRFDLERQLEALGQGVLSNDQSVLAAISMNRSANQRALQAAQALLPAGRAGMVGGQPAAPGAAPAPGATGGTTQVLTFDENGNMVQ